MTKSDFNFEDGKASFYTSFQRRWQETADPEIESQTFHITKDEAIKACHEISLKIQFDGMVDQIIFTEEDFDNSFDEDSEFTLEELANDVYQEREEVYNSPISNTGNCIEDAIIICWSWEKYIGYARNFHSIRLGHQNETEANIFSNQDSTSKQYEEVLLTAEEVADLSDDQKLETIMEAISKDSFKWNTFRSHPTADKVTRFLNLQVDQAE